MLWHRGLGVACRGLSDGPFLVVRVKLDSSSGQVDGIPSVNVEERDRS